jgi:hypothetical protein
VGIDWRWEYFCVEHPFDVVVDRQLSLDGVLNLARFDWMKERGENDTSSVRRHGQGGYQINEVTRPSSRPAIELCRLTVELRISRSFDGRRVVIAAMFRICRWSNVPCKARCGHYRSDQQVAGSDKIHELYTLQAADCREFTLGNRSIGQLTNDILHEIVRYPFPSHIASL